MKIKKVKFNLSYKEYKINDIIVVSQEKDEQKFFFELINSGYCKLIEEYV
jgi:hypothetical protein